MKFNIFEKPALVLALSLWVESASPSTESVEAIERMIAGRSLNMMEKIEVDHFMEYIIKEEDEMYKELETTFAYIKSSL